MASLASEISMTMPLGVMSGSMRAGRFAFSDVPLTPLPAAVMRGDSPWPRGGVTAAPCAPAMADAKAYARGNTCVDNVPVIEDRGRWLWIEQSLNQLLRYHVRMVCALTNAMLVLFNI